MKKRINPKSNSKSNSRSNKDTPKKIKQTKQKQENKILNSREKKEIFNLIDNAWGTDSKKILKEFIFVRTQKDKIYFLTKDLLNFDYNKLFDLRLNSFGIYFGKIEREKIRLTIEGSQIIKNNIKKNMLKLDKKEIKLWMKGEDLFFESLNEIKKKTKYELKLDNFVILINQQKDVFGCGKISTKNIQGKEMFVLNNYVPKSRRITNLA